MRIRTILEVVLRAAWHRFPKGKRVRVARGLIHQTDPDEQCYLGVMSLGGVLSLMNQNGFIPSLVVDVGANRGNWTREAQRVFRSSRFFLVDGDPVNTSALEELCSSLPQCDYSISLLGSEPRKSVQFCQMGTGSSVLPERTSAARSVIEMPMTTLDELVDVDVDDRVLLKLDVQGYEIEVLRGATKVLSKAEVIILECSLIEYNIGAPLFAEVVSFMKQRGFLVYDFCAQMRHSDGVLFQTDVVFARENSALRRVWEAGF